MAATEQNMLNPQATLFGNDTPEDCSTFLGEKDFHGLLQENVDLCYLSCISFFAGGDYFAKAHYYHELTKGMRRRGLLEEAAEVRADGAFHPISKCPILHRIAGDKFQLFELKLTDVITEERINDMFDGRVDIDLQLSSYLTKSFIISYSYIDLLGGLKERIHAVSAKYSQLHNCWMIRDSNE